MTLAVRRGVGGEADAHVADPARGEEAADQQAGAPPVVAAGDASGALDPGDTPVRSSNAQTWLPLPVLSAASAAVSTLDRDRTVAVVLVAVPGRVGDLRALVTG